ncbi:amino acid-binding protein [Candidatus Magnetomorum sp. HK-1]|nr:amino acid-binding protein [Candidatus Magnetomorum sp. HK-1]
MEQNKYTIRQISVFLVNKPGTLGEITNILANREINLRAFSLSETRDFGSMRIIVHNTEKACQVLDENSIHYSLVDVFAVEIEDQPGGLSNVLNILLEVQINVEYAYTMLVTRNDQKAIAIIRTNDIQKSISILQNNHKTLITEKDIEEL